MKVLITHLNTHRKRAFAYKYRSSLVLRESKFPAYPSNMT